MNQVIYNSLINECIRNFPLKIRNYLYESQLEIIITNEKLCNIEDCYGYVFLKNHQIILRERENLSLMQRTFYHEIAHYLDYYFFDFEKFYSEHSKSFQKAWECDKAKFYQIFFFINENILLDKPEIFAYILSYYMLQNEKDYKKTALFIQNKCPNLWSEIEKLIENNVN